MKLGLGALVLLLVSLVGYSDARCSQIVTRREIRSLTYDERARYFRAIKAMNSGSSPTLYDRFSVTHMDWARPSHGDARFLPWHRVFIREFEKELQRIDPTIVLPYWDWGRDARKPAESRILSSALYGTNGGVNGCVTDGVFSGWKIFYPNNTRRCLTRQFDRGDSISPWWGTSALNNIKQTSQDYDNFRRRIEGPHGNVHVQIGGDFAPMHSPNEPLFWLHHTFVDKLWNDWQLRNDRNLRDYGGSHFDDTPAVASETLGPWNTRVEQVLDTTSDGFCYRYDNIRPTEGGVWRMSDLETTSEEALAATTVDTDDSLPEPLPEWYIKMNNMNVTEIRQYEDEMRQAEIMARKNKRVVENSPAIF
ncbi:hypothetical protein IWQ61_001421 [Dispira simplex]|nr:hypothetical protein IWQ61_001421 [Dispira simplex]